MSIFRSRTETDSDRTDVRDDDNATDTGRVEHDPSGTGHDSSAAADTHDVLDERADQDTTATVEGSGAAENPVSAWRGPRDNAHVDDVSGAGESRDDALDGQRHDAHVDDGSGAAVTHDDAVGDRGDDARDDEAPGTLISPSPSTAHDPAAATPAAEDANGSSAATATAGSADSTAAATSGTATSAKKATAAAGQAEPERLVPQERAEAYSSRWQSVKSGFVDEPRQAVGEADALVGELLDELQKLFADQRKRLEDGLDADTTSTEDLRLALRRYRSFFDRLVSF